ncbi:hypothetical protein C8Q74DRAFT_398394 [Fomes fomentarius]|nr:hypothetical protein C8Q74DRAFT_398394 [Fomes fomentarius]
MISLCSSNCQYVPYPHTRIVYVRTVPSTSQYIPLLSAYVAMLHHCIDVHRSGWLLHRRVQCAQVHSQSHLGSSSCAEPVISVCVRAFPWPVVSVISLASPQRRGKGVVFVHRSAHGRVLLIEVVSTCFARRRRALKTRARFTNCTIVREQHKIISAFMRHQVVGGLRLKLEHPPSRPNSKYCDSHSLERSQLIRDEGRSDNLDRWCLHAEMMANPPK